MKKINIIQLLQKIQSGTQPKTIKVFDNYYDWNGEDYFNDRYGEYVGDSYEDKYFLKDLVNECFIEIPEPVSLTKAEKKLLEAIIELRGLPRNVIISKHALSYQIVNPMEIVFKDINNAENTYTYVFAESYFKGIEFNHDYTPDDLGLFNEEDK